MDDRTSVNGTGFHRTRYLIGEEHSQDRYHTNMADVPDLAGSERMVETQDPHQQAETKWINSS